MATSVADEKEKPVEDSALVEESKPVEQNGEDIEEDGD